MGGGGSNWGLPGGVLKGDVFSCGLYCGAGSGCRDMGLLAILGFSALLIVGGALLVASRRNSPDLRGGGGDGGRDRGREGDLAGSKPGESDLLGILNGLGEGVPGNEVAIVSAER